MSNRTILRFPILYVVQSEGLGAFPRLEYSNRRNAHRQFLVECDRAPCARVVLAHVDGRVLEERPASTPTFFAAPRVDVYVPPEETTARELEHISGPLSRVLAGLRRLLETEVRS